MQINKKKTRDLKTLTLPKKPNTCFFLCTVHYCPILGEGLANILPYNNYSISQKIVVNSDHQTINEWHSLPLPQKRIFIVQIDSSRSHNNNVIPFLKYSNLKSLLERMSRFLELYYVANSLLNAKVCLIFNGDSIRWNWF